MEPRKWKKIVLAITVVFGLVFTFWYGGGSAGLHGFSVTEESKEYTVDEVQGEAGGDETVRQDGEQTGDVKEKSTGNDSVKPAEKKNIFQQFFMHITKKDSSGSNSKKTVQNSQTAQKNANKAADKAKKKNKKSKNKNKTANKKTTDKENTEKGGTDTDTGQSEQAMPNNENRAGVNTDEQAAEQTTEALKMEEMISCTISISCAILLDHMNDLKEAKKTQVPKDGVILGETTVKVKAGSTVFDVLQSVTKTKKIHLEYSFTPGFKSYYIEGIHNLYEFDAGDLSGWMYSVNGDFQGDSCSAYNVEDGDVIQWVYTCNLGKDIGGYFEE